jgi:hypothetical protein
LRFARFALASLDRFALAIVEGFLLALELIAADRVALAFQLRLGSFALYPHSSLFMSKPTVIDRALFAIGGVVYRRFRGARIKAIVHRTPLRVF